MRLVFFVNTHRLTNITMLSAAGLAFAAPVMANPPRKLEPGQHETEERLVLVTGSLIPKRVKVQRIGTKTVSSVRAIDRSEIDQNGRQSTSGLLLNDPSVSVINR